MVVHFFFEREIDFQHFNNASKNVLLKCYIRREKKKETVYYYQKIFNLRQIYQNYYCYTLLRDNPWLRLSRRMKKRTMLWKRFIMRCPVPRDSFFHGVDSNESKISLTFLTSLHSPTFIRVIRDTKNYTLFFAKFVYLNLFAQSWVYFFGAISFVCDFYQDIKIFDNLIFVKGKTI